MCYSWLVLIDQTRYKAFWSNPEYFRLRYLKDLDAKIEGAPNKYGRDRGTVFHILNEGAEDAEAQIKEAVQSPAAITMARTMHTAYKQATNPKFKTLAKEVAFMVSIGDGRNGMAGRIDSIIETASGLVWCGETKTAGTRADLAAIKWEWQRNPQADFEIIGARSLGYDVEGVLVHIIKEAVPAPRVWQIEVKRTPEQLATLERNVYMTCEIIQMLITQFGIDKPWPHVIPGFNPCVKTGYCDFEQDCSSCNIDSSKYTKRKEHLEGMEQWSAA